jgi:hypothetical protein
MDQKTKNKQIYFKKVKKTEISLKYSITFRPLRHKLTAAHFAKIKTLYINNYRQL